MHTNLYYKHTKLSKAAVKYKSCGKLSTTFVKKKKTKNKTQKTNRLLEVLIILFVNNHLLLSDQEPA